MRVQGIIICSCEKGTKSFELLNSFCIPHVAVDSYPDFYNGAYIANDFYACGTNVAEHLYEVGCRRPGIINADSSMVEFSAFKKTFFAYEEYFNNKGITINKETL
jgi:DNA-binding LacI/PurR family transcriptional regulator